MGPTIKMTVEKERGTSIVIDEGKIHVLGFFGNRAKNPFPHTAEFHVVVDANVDMNCARASTPTTC